MTTEDMLPTSDHLSQSQQWQQEQCESVAEHGRGGWQGLSAASRMADCQRRLRAGAPMWPLPNGAFISIAFKNLRTYFR